MRARSFLTIAGLGFATSISCHRADDTGAAGIPDAGSFDKAALLRAFGDCTLATYKEFQAANADLDAATHKLDATGADADRAAAQEAWKKAIDAWERAELFAFGPQALPAQPGGKDLRNAIYAWPLVSRCSVEEKLVDGSYDTPAFTTAALASTRTLAATEYLLFYTGTDDACLPGSAINTSGSWAALGPDLAKKKAAYARASTADVVVQIGALVDAWDPAKGNFYGTFTGAGGNALYTSQQAAFNAVTNAVFYVEDQVKNQKVGKPLGIYMCSTPTCPDAIESQWAKRGKAHLANNMVGYQKLMFGCTSPTFDGLGFDDLLVAVGAGSVADDLKSKVTGVNAALAALGDATTLDQDLVQNKAGVTALSDALRALVAMMKAEFVTDLDLDLPAAAGQDND